MKNLLITANWKSNKLEVDAKEWLKDYGDIKVPQNIAVVLFAPFTLLKSLFSEIQDNNLNIKLGTQNISPFGKGPFTGEINAAQIKEFAEFVLIGHSERRSNFLETDKMINQKIEIAITSGLTPVVCVSNIEQVKKLQKDNLIIAYEPIEAIGSGMPDDPKNTQDFARKIKKEKSGSKILYGGSVNSENVSKYTNLDGVNGVLVGGESLNLASFGNIIKNAS